MRGRVTANSKRTECLSSTNDDPWSVFASPAHASWALKRYLPQLKIKGSGGKAPQLIQHLLPCASVPRQWKCALLPTVFLSPTLSTPLHHRLSKHPSFSHRPHPVPIRQLCVANNDSIQSRPSEISHGIDTRTDGSRFDPGPAGCGLWSNTAPLLHFDQFIASRW